MSGLRDCRRQQLLLRHQPHDRLEDLLHERDRRHLPRELHLAGEVSGRGRYR